MRMLRLLPAIVLAVGLAGGVGARSLGPSDWTRFRLNPQSNAVIPGDLSVAWSIETHGGFSSSPTLVDGVVYIGNNAGQMTAVDVTTGHVLWKQKVSTALMAEPLVVGNVVIVGEGNESVVAAHSIIRVGATGENALLAYDRITGKPLWRLPLSGSVMPTPAIVDGLLYDHSGGGDLTALDPVTGRVHYSANVGTVASMSAITPVSGSLLVTNGQTDTSVVGVRAADGVVVWRHSFPLASGLGDCPTASDGERVYCNYLAPIAPDPYVIPEHIGIERAFALDARTGALVWDVAVGSGKVPWRNQSAIPLVDNGTVFFGSSVGKKVHALDARTGALRWATKVHGPVKGGIVAVDGVVYFGDIGGYLWALNERTGKPIGMANMKTPFNVGSPLVVGKTLIIGSRSGRLLAIPLATIRARHDAYVKLVMPEMPPGASGH